MTGGGRRHVSLADPASIPELMVVLEAIRNGARRSRLRQLTIACPNNHWLAEVYPTAAGPVILGRDTSGRYGAVRLADLRPQGHPEGSQRVKVGCKCSTARFLHGGTVDFWLKAGKRRAVMHS